jgi:hypothetical protein
MWTMFVLQDAVSNSFSNNEKTFATLYKMLREYKKCLPRQACYSYKENNEHVRMLKLLTSKSVTIFLLGSNVSFHFNNFKPNF